MASTTKTTLVVEADNGNVIFGLSARAVTVQTPRGREIEITDKADLKALSDAFNEVVVNSLHQERPSASRAPQA
jgi:hypothetical protein